ncbi:MAG: hypothetical protein BWY76_02872 [bacterium ADurb.Bin429]|nr:MAG: hypothetical protein BWY76_02872 [bacterium ADurb.Bin429]
MRRQCRQRALFRLGEAAPAQRAIRSVIQPVKLQIHLKTAGKFTQRGGNVGILGDAQAVGVEHHVADARRPRQPDDFQDVRMARRLTTTELQYLGLAVFRLLESVQHALNRFQGQRRAGVSLRETDRAPQIARRRHLQQPDAGVLLVIGTQPAVLRAAAVKGSLRQRGGAGFVILRPAQVKVGVLFQQFLVDAVFQTRLAQIHGTAAQHDFRRHPRPAVRTQADGESVETVILFTSGHAQAVLCGIAPAYRATASLSNAGTRTYAL